MICITTATLHEKEIIKKVRAEGYGSVKPGSELIEL